ncbi:hypothetical protein [Xanthomonas vasicola]|uniref:hypothetical protein n=1 Tax=Xanthomonas vasicola TaxID=56459 RepID=UPI000382402F|nr:hypothetical protein [Xanthomonas vasicola]KFA30412.1 hypothetical protein KW5_0104735 [Xanthomonas vasicola pv. vasculorum NCPPB 1326]
MDILFASQRHHLAQVWASRAHHVAGHAVIGELEARPRLAVNQLDRTESVVRSTAQAVLGGLYFRDCAAQRVAGSEYLALWNTLCAALAIISAVNASAAGFCVLSVSRTILA